MRQWAARLNPWKLWARSLPFRVVLTTMSASVVILVATGWFLIDQSSRGIIAGKTQASVAEAAAVVDVMQRDLSTTDLRTTTLGERITRLGRDATNRGQAGSQYLVVIETRSRRSAVPAWRRPAFRPRFGRPWPAATGCGARRP